MSATARFPATPATRALEAAGVVFEGHVFPYVEKGGTRHSSAVLGVDEHAVIKTLMFEDSDREPMCVLMHGDRLVSEKQLARATERRTIRPCEPATAERHSGYQVGGTSPFGLRKAMSIFAEATIFELPRIWINGGRRGFLVSMLPSELERVLKPVRVSVALSRS